MEEDRSTGSIDFRARKTAPIRDYTAIRNKHFYFIISAADSEESMMERTIECFRGFLDCLEGAVERGVVYGVGAWKKGDVKSLSSMVHAFDLGKAV